MLAPCDKDSPAIESALAFAAYNAGVAQALFDLHNAAVAGSLDPHVK